MSFLAGISLTSPDGIFGGILQATRSLFYWIGELIYQIIAIVYQLFEDISNAKLLNDEMFRTIATKIGYILGIIMLFMVIFDFIQILLEPDKMTDKDSGMVSMLKKSVLVLVMLGMSNFFFNMLYSIQDYIISEKLIYNIILPTDNTQVDTEKFGQVLSARVFTAFYTLNPNLEENSTDQNIADCKNYRNLLMNRIALENDFSAGNYCLNTYTQITDENGNTNDKFIMDYNFILQIVVGIAIVYIFINYVIKIGIRIIQLTVLQIISPMAIIGYLSPKKDNMFSKWWKIYFSTYIDVFIRLGIIYFMVYLSSLLLDSVTEGTSTFWQSVGDNSNHFMILVVMIIALLNFALKAPELIKELIPASASKLGFEPSMKNIKGLKKSVGIGTSMVAGAAGGAAVGLLGGTGVGGRLGGLAGGLFKGGFRGIKGEGIRKTASGAWKNQSAANKKMAEIRANGGSWLGSHIASAQGAMGIQNAYERTEHDITLAQKKVDQFNEAKAEAESEAKKNGARYKLHSYDGNMHSLTELEMLQSDQSYSAADRAKYHDEYNRLLKSATEFNQDYGLAVEKGSVEFNNSGTFNSLTGNSGTVYTSMTDVNAIANKSTEIGNSNAKIEVNMANVTGTTAQSGRASAGKTIRNTESAYITRTKGSAQYDRDKANAGK